jgi:hypothetical protein
MSQPGKFRCRSCNALSPEDEKGSEFGFCIDCYSDELEREAVWRCLGAYDDNGSLVLKGE